MFRLRNAAAVFTTLMLVSLSPLMASEADLKIPNLASQKFLGMDGRTLLLLGLGACVLGLIFGLIEYVRLKNLPVHKVMLDVSELIYETCKTYMVTQGKFLGILWIFIAAIMIYYFGFLAQGGIDAAGKAIHGYGIPKVAAILACSVVGIAGDAEARPGVHAQPPERPHRLGPGRTCLLLRHQEQAGG